MCIEATVRPPESSTDGGFLNTNIEIKARYDELVVTTFVNRTNRIGGVKKQCPGRDSNPTLLPTNE
tara:strand:- start:222 stop:419 length:198 start_codon:yes stop_codon:yes gene_type:complete